ncbi:LysM peptidoglycan-binding domain-containing protein [Nonomuraea sp. NPDC050680]|uniref:LysM peptidoglycan-binding domain-containing protein n=1 Tax=Nonomuraea sp. NPDC050680 TaxID=3154630 RepID=UPI0033DE1184
MALLSLGGFWLGTRAVSQASAAPAVPSHAGLPWVTVHEGDTLWTIADAAAPDEGDPGAVVTEIKRLNDLRGSLIRPGSRLYVPTPHALP